LGRGHQTGSLAGQALVGQALAGQALAGQALAGQANIVQSPPYPKNTSNYRGVFATARR